MKRRFLRDFARDFTRDTSGGVLIYTALASTVMLGMVGLAVDLSYWYQGKRDMQSAADAAAMAAVLEMARGSDPADLERRAKDIANLNGYLDAEVSIENPPLSGVYAGDTDYVEVVVSQPQVGFFSSIIHSGGMPVAARAVGTFAGAPACVLALNPTEVGALSISGNTDVVLNCGAQSNSTDDEAIDQVGGAATLTATSVQSSGGYDCGGCSPTPTANMPQAADPFSYLSPPDTSVACKETLTYAHTVGNVTLDPGYYCGGITIKSGTVTFNEGVYLLGGQGLQVTGNAFLRSAPSGDGQVFYITDAVNTATNKAVFISGLASTDIWAPESGNYEGILFYADPNLDPTEELVLIGGADMELNGVIYNPEGHVEYQGNASSTDNWTSIIADTVEFSGDSTLSSAGFVGGNLPLALTAPSLAE